MASATAQKSAEKIDAATYDAVPYESYAYPHTHPANLFVVGSLFGLKPAAIDTAKVLELGCASGGNLFSLALTHPGAHFHGIDLSAEQIAQGNAAKEWLGVTNVTLEQMDITQFDLNKHKGAYDYIICHGVFSWVPDVVREKILELCRACMAPNGLAIVSYNTLPGWNAVRSLREMMLFHTSRFENPAEKIAQAKALLNFLAENVPDNRTGYKAVIEDERKMLSNTNDSYLFHDHLEHTNSQFYFHQFMQMAAKHDLAYLGDTSITSMFVGNMPKGAMETLQAVNDIVGQEQYMDFVTNRRFRNTILCHKENAIKRALDENQIFDFKLAAQMRPEEGKTTPPMNFIAPGGGQFTANDDIGVALFTALCEAGGPVDCETLVKMAVAKLPKADPEAFRLTLRQSGLKLALHGYIALHAESSPAAKTLSEKPEVFKWARWQAAQPGSKSVTNMMHTLVNSDLPGNMVMMLLDGTRTVPQVVDAMIENVKSGKLTVKQGETPVTDDATIRTHMTAVVDQLLPRLLQQHLIAA